MEETPLWLLTVLSFRTLILTRLVIYTDDIVKITGRAERTARKILQKIKEHHHRTKEMFVTIVEFCEYTGLKEEEVRKVIR